MLIWRVRLAYWKEGYCQILGLTPTQRHLRCKLVCLRYDCPSTYDIITLYWKLDSQCSGHAASPFIEAPDKGEEQGQLNYGGFHTKGNRVGLPR